MSTPSDGELEMIRQRVASHPNDLQCRFELGVALYNRRDYAAALIELQRAMNSPTVRLRAMRLIVEIFDIKGMREMAAEMRKWISRESGDEEDSGSAPKPVPTGPLKPRDSSGAAATPHEDDHAA